MTEPEEEFRIGVKRRVFNATLRDAIRRTGKTIPVVALELQIPHGRLQRYLAFRQYPTEEVRLRMAIYFGIPDDVLFPPDLAALRLDHQPKETHLTLAEFKALSNSYLLAEPQTPERAIELRELKEAVAEVVSTLGEREQKVLALRYGLAAGGQSLSLTEIGALMGLGRERIRQIEATALHRLRGRSKVLRQFHKGRTYEEESNDREAATEVAKRYADHSFTMAASVTSYRCATCGRSWGVQEAEAEQGHSRDDGWYWCCGQRFRWAPKRLVGGPEAKLTGDKE